MLYPCYSLTDSFDNLVRKSKVQKLPCKTFAIKHGEVAVHSLLECPQSTEVPLECPALLVDH